MIALESLQREKEDLRLRSPVEIEETTGAVYHPHAREFSLLYFGNNCRISYLNGEITWLDRSGREGEKDENIILQYLNAKRIKELSEQWRYCARSLLIKNREGIINNIIKLGGKREQIGENIFLLPVLPKIIFRLELNYEVKIYLSNSAYNYLPEISLDYLVNTLLSLL